VRQLRCRLLLISSNVVRSAEAQSTCTSEQFTCQKQHGCVPLKWRCDGDPDCGDETDEENCPSCAPGFFQCGSLGSGRPLEDTAATKVLKAMTNAIGPGAQCVPVTARCDRTEDCLDGSDEMDCGESICVVRVNVSVGQSRSAQIIFGPTLKNSSKFSPPK